MSLGGPIVMAIGFHQHKHGQCNIAGLVNAKQMLKIYVFENKVVKVQITMYIFCSPAVLVYSIYKHGRHTIILNTKYTVDSFY